MEEFEISAYNHSQGTDLQKPEAFAELIFPDERVYHFMVYEVE